MASPMRVNDKFEDLVNDDSKQTKASMHSHSNSFMKLFHVSFK
jgi:hypothetical protein